MLRFLLPTLLLCCFTACKHTTTDTPAPLPDPGLTWQTRPDFIYGDKVQLSSYADSSLIILAGSQTTSIALGSARPATDTSFTHYGGLAQPNGETYQRPAITSKLIAFAHSDFVNLVSVISPVTNYSNSYVRLDDLDPDFAQTYFVPSFRGECMAVNQQQQILIPYYRYDRSYSTPVLSGNSLNFALITTTIAPVSGFIGVKNVQRISIATTGQVGSLIAQGDYMYVGVYGSSGTYRIAPDGSYKQIFPNNIENFFIGNGVLYGFTYAGTSNYKLIASTDQGNTWRVIADQLSSNYQSLQVKQIGNQIIAWYNSQLFQLTITPTGVTATELDNTGLIGNQITSVATFRNTVYVSSLSGVFTKPVRTFLTPKKV